MKIGIYLSGLGEAFTGESLEKYARRFADQYDLDNIGRKPRYETHIDQFEYDKERHLIAKRAVISEIVDGQSTIVYKLFEYKYTVVLTRSFKDKNPFTKSFLLFTCVCSKLPLMFYRLFYLGKNVGYQPRFRGQALYLFLLFFIVSLAIVSLLPMAVAVFFELVNKEKWLEQSLATMGIDHGLFDAALKVVSNITALLILLMPGFNQTLVQLATEFVSASNYLDRGDNKQIIHGQLDLLVERIIDVEGDDNDLYLHSFSFGTLICLDFVFPYGIRPSVRLRQYLKGLITIGSPVDFIGVYFPLFLEKRNMTLRDQVQWINVYSLADALASNFRIKGNEGPAEYSFDINGPKPVNVRYEVASVEINIITQFFTLYALKAHGSYWEVADNGQSCFREIIPAMKELNFI